MTGIGIGERIRNAEKMKQLWDAISVDEHIDNCEWLGSFISEVGLRFITCQARESYVISPSDCVQKSPKALSKVMLENAGFKVFTWWYEQGSYTLEIKVRDVMMKRGRGGVIVGYDTGIL